MRRLLALCFVTMGLVSHSAACVVAPPGGDEDSVESAARRRGMSLPEFTGYIRAQVAARQSRVWLTDMDWLTSRWSWERGTHAFTEEEQRGVIKTEVLENDAVSLGYIVRLKLNEYVTGTPDTSWQEGWPVNSIDLSERFPIGGSGHIQGQRVDGGTLGIRIFGPDLDHLQAEVKGPKSFQSKSWLSPLARSGYHFDSGGPDGVSFQLLSGSRVAVYYYKSSDDSLGRAWKFVMGNFDFMPETANPVVARLTHTASVLCGDGQVDMTEECDGRDLRGASCSSPGYSSPAKPACNEQCRLDMSPCFQP